MRFVRDLFTEPDGKWSLARVGSAFVVLVSVAWVTFLVILWGRFPDMLGLSAYVTGTVTALYGANKISAAIIGKPSNG